MWPTRKSPPGTAQPRDEAARPRTCGEDLPQDHLRHLLGGQPGPPQHFPDGGGPQLVRRQRRQAAVEGAWADTEGESSAPRPGWGLQPPGPSGNTRRPARPLTDGGPGGGDEDDGVRAHGGSSGGRKAERERGCSRGRSAKGAGAGAGAAPRVLPIPPLSCRRVGRAAAGRGGGRRAPARRDSWPRPWEEREGVRRRGPPVPPARWGRIGLC